MREFQVSLENSLAKKRCSFIGNFTKFTVIKKLFYYLFRLWCIIFTGNYNWEEKCGVQKVSVCLQPVALFCPS